MRIAERTIGGITILDLEGDLSEGDGDDGIRDAVNRLVDGGRIQVLLNMAGVPHIDSSVLGVLASKHITLRRRHGQLKLCNLSPRNYRMLETTRLLKVFDVFDTETEAVESFGRSS